LPPEAAALAIPSGTPPGCEPLSWSRCARRHEPPDLSPGDPAAPPGPVVPPAATSVVAPRRHRSTRSCRGILRAGSRGVTRRSGLCRATSRRNSAAISSAASSASGSAVPSAWAAARGLSSRSRARGAGWPPTGSARDGGDGHGTGVCCDTTAKPRSHDTSRIAWAKLMARVGEEFPFASPGCGGDIRLREDGRQEPAHFEPEVRKRAKARMASPA